MEMSSVLISILCAAAFFIVYCFGYMEGTRHGIDYATELTVKKCMDNMYEAFKAIGKLDVFHEAIEKSKELINERGRV